MSLEFEALTGRAAELTRVIAAGRSEIFIGGEVNPMWFDLETLTTYKLRTCLYEMDFLNQYKADRFWDLKSCQ